MAVRAQSLRGSILTGAPSVDPPVRAQQLRGSILAGAPTVAPAVRTQQLRGSILAGAAFIPPVRVPVRSECEFIWLLDLQISGRVYRFADRPIDVDTFAGDTLRYDEGLAPLIWSSATDGAVDFSVPIEVVSSAMWAQLVSDFVRVERAPAVLRRLRVGDLLEDARTIVSGFVEGVSYGATLDPLAFVVRRPGSNVGETIPLTSMTVDSSTWPAGARTAYAPDPKILGAYYPIVIGFPGHTPGQDTDKGEAATEALITETQAVPDNTERVLVAGHRVNSTFVELWDYTEDEPEQATAAVAHMVDNTGREIAYVLPGALFTPDVTVGRVYYVGWSPAGGGGVLNPFGTGPLRGAGDIIEWLITRWTTLEFDAARFSAVRDRLNLYLIDTYINDPIDPVEWLMAAIIPLLPVEPRNGEAGLYFTGRRTELTKADAVAHIDTATGEYDRISDITILTNDIFNEVSVEYCPDRASGRYRKRTTVSAVGLVRTDDELEQAEMSDSRIRGSYLAALSQSLYGRLSTTITAAAVCDASTADRIADDVLERHALPVRHVEFEGGCETEERLRVGDIVLVSDADTSLVEQLAEVRDVVIGGASVQVLVELLDDPVIG